MDHMEQERREDAPDLERERRTIPRPAAVAFVPGPRARDVRAASLRGLFILACLYTLQLAKPFLIPLVVGVIVYFLLRPAVRVLARARIPESVGALLVLTGLLSVVGVGLYALSYPAANWVALAPQSIRRVEARLRPVVKRIQSLSRTAEQVEKIATAGAGAEETTVQLKEPGLGNTLFIGLQSFLGGSIIVLALVYFLLAAGDEVLGKIVHALPRLQDRTSAVDIARELEKQISSYILTTTALNAGFGVVVGLSMWALGMPNPALWGVLAGVTNFIPYLGGLLCMGVLSLAALLTFDDPWRAALVPAVFFLLNTVEGYLITPVIMGRRFTLNPLVLFVGLLFWYYVWGIAGGLLAVPMMAAFKIFCERVDSLQGLADFMGEESTPSVPVRPTAAKVVAG
jgi:predicted PurR-regulated permease PerM